MSENEFLEFLQQAIFTNRLDLRRDFGAVLSRAAPMRKLYANDRTPRGQLHVTLEDGTRFLLLVEDVTDSKELLPPSTEEVESVHGRTV